MFKQFLVEDTFKSGWRTKHLNSPIQQDSYNCGFFTLMTCIHLYLYEEIKYDTQDIQSIRDLSKGFGTSSDSNKKCILDMLQFRSERYKEELSDENKDSDVLINNSHVALSNDSVDDIFEEDAASTQTQTDGANVGKPSDEYNATCTTTTTTRVVDNTKNAVTEEDTLGKEAESTISEKSTSTSWCQVTLKRYQDIPRELFRVMGWSLGWQSDPKKP